MVVGLCITRPAQNPTRRDGKRLYHRFTMTTHITIHTKETADPRTFECFWTTGNKQGVVETRNDDPRVDDPAIIAELSALHHLLSYRSILGEGRAGNSLTITVSFGAIRRVANRSSDKKHLFVHARFLGTRYSEAEIKVDKDASWIRPGKANARRETLAVREPIEEIVDVAGFGKVALSHHIIEQMMKRANYASVGAAWRHLCSMLGGKLRRVSLPKRVLEHKELKHGATGCHLQAVNTPWFFVIGSNRPSCSNMPTLCTAYVRLS